MAILHFSALPLAAALPFAAFALTDTHQTTAPRSAAAAAAEPAPLSDAAARHARRVACLKEARVRKLLGADKTAYVKSCVGPR